MAALTLVVLLVFVVVGFLRGLEATLRRTDAITTPFQLSASYAEALALVRQSVATLLSSSFRMAADSSKAIAAYTTLLSSREETTCPTRASATPSPAATPSCAC